MDYNIKKEVLEKWLRQLFETSESEKLENAISYSKMFSVSEEAVEISNTIAVLLRAEKSGDINPPIKMRELYRTIVEEAKANKKKASREVAC